MALNFQGSIDDPYGGINWTHVFGPQTGATSNITGGCFHDCQWTLPNGQRAICYAKGTVDRRRSGLEPGEGTFYPQGFEHHYWNPSRLHDFTKGKARKQRLGIFADSMSDLFGHWVESSQIEQVLSAFIDAPWHVFFVLTKNPARLAEFVNMMPPNLWVGVSMPPDYMWGNHMHSQRKAGFFKRALGALRGLKVAGFEGVTWCSFEPLSYDVTEWFTDDPLPLDWAVIGAATDGATVMLPEEDHVRKLMARLDAEEIPVCFKDNMAKSPAADPWRFEFPAVPDLEPGVGLL